MDFRDYQVKFLKYQVSFIYWSENIDYEIHRTLLNIAERTKIDDLYRDSESDEENIKQIVFEYCALDNLDERNRKLDAFVTETREKLQIQKTTITGLEISFPFDYVRDGKGKIEPEKLFSRWDRYLKVLKLKAKGFNNTQISQELGGYRESDVQNSLNAVRRDLKEAQQLVVSILTASFPYPENETLKVPKP